MIFKFLFVGGREEGKEREGRIDRERYRETRQREANETTPDRTDTKTSPLSSFKSTETDVLIMIFVKLISSDFHL